MKRFELTSEWLSNWRPRRKDDEVADRGCKGLVVRGQPGGIKTLYRWSSIRDPATGAVKRKRVRLGRWPALSLGDARELVNEAREPAAAGGGDATVEALALHYRRAILAHREPASLAWSWGIVKRHVIEGRPDPKRPPFGQWPARTVRAPDIAAIVRTAREERTVEMRDAKGKAVRRHVGGVGAARATFREVKAIFNAAVGSGLLEMSPAAVLQAGALGLRNTKRGRYLNADEVKALFDVLNLNALLDGVAKEARLTEAVRLAIALLLYVPVRSHSLIGARWEEIDLKARRWAIPVTRQKMHRDARAEARPFTVTLPATAVMILERLRDLAGESPWVLASAKREQGHIGSKVMIRALTRLQKSGRLAAGAPFVVHDLRRSWRTWAGELGISFEVAEKSLGHVLPGVADVYARAEMIDQRAEAAELVGAAFDRIRLGGAARIVPLAETRGSAG